MPTRWVRPAKAERLARPADAEQGYSPDRSSRILQPIDVHMLTTPLNVSKRKMMEFSLLLLWIMS
jgi:hypothetical protein